MRSTHGGHILGIAALALVVGPRLGRSDSPLPLPIEEVVSVNDLSPGPAPGVAGRGRVHRIYRVVQQVISPDRHPWVFVVSSTGDVSGYLRRDQVMSRENAFDGYTNRIRIAPNHAESYLRRGYLWRGWGEDAIALLDFDKAIEIDRAYAEAYAARGRLRYDQGRFRNALEDYTLAMVAGGDRAQLDIEIGEALRAEFEATKDGKTLDKAIDHFTHALKIDPNLALAYAGRAEALRTRGHARDLENAKHDYDQGIRNAPYLAPAYVGRGTYSYMLKDYARAFEDAGKAIALNDRYAPAYRLQGRTALAANRLDLALSSLGRAIELAPYDAASYLERGRAFLRQGNPEAALSDAGQAVLYDKSCPGALMVRAEARIALAKHNFEVAPRPCKVDKDPADPALKKVKDDFMGELKTAMADIVQALRLEPRSAPAHLLRGRTREEQARISDPQSTASYEAAMDDYLTAIWLDPSLGEAYLARAWLLATGPGSSPLDGRLAWEMAVLGGKRLGFDDPRTQATLAAAYARAGDYLQAVNYQDTYVKTRAGSSDPEGKERLDKYREKARSIRTSPTPEDSERPGGSSAFSPVPH